MNFFFCSLLCRLMSGFSRRSTSLRSWSCARRQERAIRSDTEISSDFPTQEGCRNYEVFVKQISWCAVGTALCGIRSAHPPIFTKRVLLLFSLTFSANNHGMPEHVYKKIEVVGSSPKGFEDAIKNALARAEKTVRNMRWFEVTETRGDIEDGKLDHWQVTLKIGFTLEE